MSFDLIPGSYTGSYRTSIHVKISHVAHPVGLDHFAESEKVLEHPG